MADFYIDFTAGAGTGTFASPWNDYSQITGVTTADVVWVRRVSKTVAGTGPTGFGAAWPSGVPVVGWPLAGDTRFATRPAAARTAWDPDVGLYAEYRHTPASLTAADNLNLVTLGAGNNVPKTWRLARLKFYRLGTNNATAVGVLGSWSSSGASTVSLTYITENCYFEVDSTNMPSASAVVGFFSASSTSNSTHYWTDVGSTLIARSSSLAPAHILSLRGAGPFNQYQNLVVSWRNTLAQLAGTNSGQLWFMNDGSYANISGTMDNCTFELLNVNQNSNLRDLKFSSAPGLLLHRCTFKTPAGSPPGFNRMKLWNWRYNECSFIGINSLEVNDPGTSLSIATFRPGGADTGQAQLYSSAGAVFIRGSNIFFSPGGARDVDFLDAADGRAGGLALLRTVNESGSGISLRSNAILSTADVAGSPGYRKWLTLAGTAQTVSVSRVGGARYSFLLTCSNGAAAQALGIGTSEPGFDTVFVALKPGLNTITMYGAHTGFAVTPTTEDVWLEVEVPSTTGRVSTSGRANPFASVALTADTSTWNALPGVSTRFSVSVSVTVNIPVVAAVRGFCGEFGGSVYFDPSAVVS